MNDIERMILALSTPDEQEKQEDKVYPKPVLKVLSEEQIEAIHEKGMITPAEMLEEYNEMEYCPFTNGCSRCSEFENCNDCLIDHVNTKDEWLSFISLAESLFSSSNQENNEEKPKLLIRE